MAENTEHRLKGNPVRRFLRLLSLERQEIGYIYFYAIFAGIIYLSLPLGIQAIISLVLANQLSSSWGVLIGVVTLGTLFFGVLQMMQITITESLQQKIFARASLEFAYRIPRIKMEAVLKYYPPELVNRFFDTLNIQKGLPKILIDLSTATLQIVFGLLLLSFYHPFFVFFGMVLLVLLFLILRYTGPRGLRTSLEESDYKYKVAHWLEEIARTLRSFKLAGDSNLAMRKADDLVGHYLGARKRHFRVLLFQFGNVVAFKTLITGGLLILGSILLIDRELNVGQFVASEIIIILVMNSVEKLILSMETIYDVLTAVEKVGKVTDLPLERHEGINFADLDTGSGIGLHVENLCFRFPGDAGPSLKNVNFEVAPGEKVCIAGVGASGKSTLVNVLMGMYEPDDGFVAYNGVTYGNIDPLSLRGYIGACLSQKYLFQGTIRENLDMGFEHITLDKVLYALELVGLTRYVQSLPKGLDTEIVPESIQIPQSISRKLIVARCLAIEPRLLVLDESFASWDRPDQEQMLSLLTETLSATVIAISNDRSYAAKCHKIIVMEKGQIKEIGTYHELANRPYFNDCFIG